MLSSDRDSSRFLNFPYKVDVFPHKKTQVFCVKLGCVPLAREYDYYDNRCLPKPALFEVLLKGPRIKGYARRRCYWLQYDGFMRLSSFSINPAGHKSCIQIIFLDISLMLFWQLWRMYMYSVTLPDWTINPVNHWYFNTVSMLLLG